MCRVVILFCYFLFAVTAFVHPRKRVNRTDRIVGGQEVQITDYPYQLSLQFFDQHICGASILSSKWAVTAAHCTYAVFEEGGSASSLRVFAGATNLGSIQGQTVYVQTIHQHPKYNHLTVDYDISLLELASELVFGPGVAATRLPFPDQFLPHGQTAVVSGWGIVKENSIVSPSNLRTLEVTVFTNSKCGSAYTSSLITDRMMCAGVLEEGKDSCQGDSGGPLVVDGVQFGIVSWGFGCARPSYPGVYTSIPKLRRYITEVSGI